MMEVVWLKEATEDLKAVARYIAEQNPQAAYRVVTRIKAAVDTLQQIPLAGRTGRIENTRELVIVGSPYIVPYYVKEQEIRILAVFHGAQKWPGEFSNFNDVQ